MNWSRVFVALVLYGFGLVACTVGPDYRRPEVKTPPTFVEAGSTARTAVDYSPADLSAWWTVFRDPTLDDLVKRALAGNPDLKTAASRVREAREQTKIAAAAELPTLSASGNAVTFNSNRKPAATAAGATGGAAAGGLGLPIPDHLNLYSAGFDASWEVDLFGGTRRSIEAAKDTAEATEWARRDAQVSLLAEVANDYLTLRALQARIAVGQRELDRQRGQFELIRARRQNGFVTNLDVNQQTVQVETAAAQIPQLDAQARTQIHALGVLTGDTPESLTQALQSAAAPLPPPPPSLPLGLPSDLLRRRPDIRQAERRLAAANAQIGVQEANLYPKLNLLGLASFASMSASDLFSRQNLSSVGVGMLSEPIFNGGRTRASIRVAKEERAQALLTYQNTVMTAFRDVEDALARFRADDERRGALARSTVAAQNSFVIAQDQYKVGLVSFINVLQSENALLNSQDQLTQAEAQVLSDLVSLYKALGGGWSEQAASSPKQPQY